MAARLEEPLLRRYEISRAGFHWHQGRGVWQRGRLTLSDEQIDRWRLWRRSLQGWMRTRPRRRRRATS